MRPRRAVAAGLVASGVAAALLLGGCTSDADRPTDAPSAATPPSATSTPAPRQGPPGLSRPVEDRVYPEVGDPGVDALRYHLDLDWDPDSRTLQGRERLRLRATADADRLRLDLAADLTVARVRVDGRTADFAHTGKDLVVSHPVREDARHTLVIDYSGTPQPVPAPTRRQDFDTTGWTTTSDGEVWTMQEPYGAFSWYAVNDQPSDKALYDFEISVPAPWVGVANGRLVARTERDGRTVTRWTLDEPAASYLVTIAIGDLEPTEDRSPSGVPITYWTPPGRDDLVERLRRAPAALTWLEQRLGPYPFGSLGFVVVDSLSGMETQTMITLGDSAYATSPEVIVHEIAHHWYGDQVTPTDWRDVWMNEGMAMYLQAVWQDQAAGPPLEDTLDEWAEADEQLRNEHGPPADYDPESFGASNVYTTPAVLWDEVRTQLGDDLFWQLVREWPAAHDNGNAGYDDLTAWWSDRAGEDLTGLFDAWLLGSSTPERAS